eukprot:TRINITY_DN19135_c0_g1_i1.p1 TRINITY_DN19135_c0_g1~~TRINITY_DN19135_c0_g1_i1.p1  ORF type:complete len:390 (+),score=69.90 TRINITY_DN19135_c0_g1_i1:49-1218(+)
MRRTDAAARKQSVKSRSMSIDSMASSKTATSSAARSVVGKLRGRGKKRDDDKMKGMLAFVEELDRVRTCYDAEIFALREAGNKDEKQIADVMDQVVEKVYLLKRSEMRANAIQQDFEEHQLKAKRQEDRLQEQLVELSQKHQRVLEKYDDLTTEKTSMEKTIENLKSVIANKNSAIDNLESSLRLAQHASVEIEDSLKKAVCLAQRDCVDLRVEHTRQERELRKKLDCLQEELQCVINGIENSLAGVDRKYIAAEEMSVSLDLLKIKYRNVLEGCRLKASRFCESLINVSSLHSNISSAIRNELLKKTPEGLISLIDTLSFEVNVKQYLEAMYPCAEEKISRYPHTPSAAILFRDLPNRPRSAPTAKLSGGRIVGSVSSLREGSGKAVP